LNTNGGRPARVSPIHPGRVNNGRSKKHVFSDDHDDDETLPHYPNKHPRTRTAGLRFDGKSNNSKIEFRATPSKKDQKESKRVRGARSRALSPTSNTSSQDGGGSATQQGFGALTDVEQAAQEEENRIRSLNPSIWLPDYYQLRAEEVREIIQILNGLSCALGSRMLFIDDVSDLRTIVHGSKPRSTSSTSLPMFIDKEDWKNEACLVSSNIVSSSETFSYYSIAPVGKRAISCPR